MNCVSCFLTVRKPNKKYISSLRSRLNPHLHYSKLRFLALRKPKTISFYSTSAVLLSYSFLRVLMPNTATAPKSNDAPATTSIAI